jgi:glutamate synthase (NADPH/NADH) large chain
VINVNRTVGAMLSGEVARKYGHKGLPDNTIHVSSHGHRRPELRRLPGARRHARSGGDANDYVGKGLSVAA